MPTLKQLTCQIQWAETNAPFAEYGTIYGDGVVETFVAVPNKPQSFNIHLTSTGFIWHGLAMVVFIDGKYQCNRNRVNLKPRNDASARNRTEVDFLLRQKEKPVGDGTYMGREWRFDNYNTVTKLPPGVDERHFDMLGTIEVLVLRCQAPDPDEANSSSTASGADSDVLGTNEVPEALAEEQMHTRGEPADGGRASDAENDSGHVAGDTAVGPTDGDDGAGGGGDNLIDALGGLQFGFMDGTYENHARMDGPGDAPQPGGSWEWTWQPDGGRRTPGGPSGSTNFSAPHGDYTQRYGYEYGPPPHRSSSYENVNGLGGHPLPPRPEKRVHFDIPSRSTLPPRPGPEDYRHGPPRSKPDPWDRSRHYHSTTAPHDQNGQHGYRTDKHGWYENNGPPPSGYYTYNAEDKRYSDYPAPPLEYVGPPLHPVPSHPAPMYCAPVYAPNYQPNMQPAPGPPLWAASTAPPPGGLAPGLSAGHPHHHGYTLPFHPPSHNHFVGHPAPPPSRFEAADTISTPGTTDPSGNDQKPGNLDPAKEDNNQAETPSKTDDWNEVNDANVDQTGDFNNDESWNKTADTENATTGENKWENNNGYGNETNGGNADWQNTGEAGNQSGSVPNNAPDWSANEKNTNNLPNGPDNQAGNDWGVQATSKVATGPQVADLSATVRELYGPHGPYYSLQASAAKDVSPDAEEEPRYDVPQFVADSGVTKQVQPGKGYLYCKKRLIPEYIDNLDEPYARFVFKYRTIDQLKKQVGIEIDAEPTGDEEAQGLQNLDKNELIQMLLRAKGALGGKIPEPSPHSKSTGSEKSFEPTPVDPPDTGFLNYNLPPVRSAGLGISTGGVGTGAAPGTSNDAWADRNANITSGNNAQQDTGWTNNAGWSGDADAAGGGGGGGGGGGADAWAGNDAWATNTANNNDTNNTTNTNNGGPWESQNNAAWSGNSSNNNNAGAGWDGPGDKDKDTSQPAQQSEKQDHQNHAASSPHAQERRNTTAVNANVPAQRPSNFGPRPANAGPHDPSRSASTYMHAPDTSNSWQTQEPTVTQFQSNPPSHQEWNRPYVPPTSDPSQGHQLSYRPGLSSYNSSANANGWNNNTPQFATSQTWTNTTPNDPGWRPSDNPAPPPSSTSTSPEIPQMKW